MLIIIQELMHRTFVEMEGRAPRRHEIPKPCDHFDLIVGTGTGGLIAIMLGRLRLDLETCKELYVRMTRVVFQTDKTIAGIPYRSTLFKASKLEEAIRSCVREHTVFEKEGNDSVEAEIHNPLSAAQFSSAAQPRRHQSNASTVSFSNRSPSVQMNRPPTFGNSRYGDPNARLYDGRENRTKTSVLSDCYPWSGNITNTADSAVTAVYKGSPRNSSPALLRSYDSRKEPPPEFDCKIWQAGRATCAIGLAFKPIQVGQSVFHDDGVGNFNPAPEALDEALISEWPGREIGVFVSIGTGRRPKGSDANQQMWYEDFLGEFAEARRRLIAKIEGCETIHEYMLREHLPKRNVSIDNYYRLNVEVGVGEFGMNEWHRLGEISTGTRRYMGRPDEQRIVQGVSSKLAKILKAKIRWERAQSGEVPGITRSPPSQMQMQMPMAAELPAGVPMHPPPPPRSPAAASRDSFESGRDSLFVTAVSPRSSHDHQPPRPVTASSSPRNNAKPGSPTLRPEDSDKLVMSSPTPDQYRNASGADKIAIMSPDEHPKQHHPGPLTSFPITERIEPPPLPPKTPLPDHQGSVWRPSQTPAPPYPIDDEAPPPVNMARKPDYWR